VQDLVHSTRFIPEAHTIEDSKPKANWLQRLVGRGNGMVWQQMMLAFAN
jgi:hypothetical protein